MENYRYKVTYLAYLMTVAFVRVGDGAILYTNDNEDYVTMYAKGFCAAKNEQFYIE